MNRWLLNLRLETCVFGILVQVIFSGRTGLTSDVVESTHFWRLHFAGVLVLVIDSSQQSSLSVHVIGVFDVVSSWILVVGRQRVGLTSGSWSSLKSVSLRTNNIVRLVGDQVASSLSSVE